VRRFVGLSFLLVAYGMVKANMPTFAHGMWKLAHLLAGEREP
jgi:hypothetical protein